MKTVGFDPQELKRCGVTFKQGRVAYTRLKVAPSTQHPVKYQNFA